MCAGLQQIKDVKGRYKKVEEDTTSKEDSLAEVQDKRKYKMGRHSVGFHGFRTTEFVQVGSCFMGVEVPCIQSQEPSL